MTPGDVWFRSDSVVFALWIRKLTVSTLVLRYGEIVDQIECFDAIGTKRGVFSALKHRRVFKGEKHEKGATP